MVKCELAWMYVLVGLEKPNLDSSHWIFELFCLTIACVLICSTHLTFEPFLYCKVHSLNCMNGPTRLFLANTL